MKATKRRIPYPGYTLKTWLHLCTLQHRVNRAQHNAIDVDLHLYNAPCNITLWIKEPKTAKILDAWHNISLEHAIEYLERDFVLLTTQQCKCKYDDD